MALGPKIGAAMGAAGMLGAGALNKKAAPAPKTPLGLKPKPKMGGGGPPAKLGFGSRGFAKPKSR